MAALATAAPGTAVGEAGEAPPECRARAEPGAAFGRPVGLSDPLSTAFMPSAAANGRAVLIAWQETVRGGSRVAYAVAVDGCVAEVRYVDDELPSPRRPSVAATSSGWVLAYEAQKPPRPVVRSVHLDLEGRVVSAPETISAPGAVASRVRVAARGDDVVYAWTDVVGHHVARRGPVETLPPTAVGERLKSAGLVNFPRLAIDDRGTILLAYRDGGPERTDFEIRLVTTDVGGPLPRPANLSRARGLMSAAVALAMEADGRLRLVWVEQDAQRPDTFEVVHATYTGVGSVAEPTRFATLGQASFKPSVVAGLATVWQVGTVRSGELWFADGPGQPVRILRDTVGGMTALAEDADGDLHLAFVDLSDPPRLRYAWRRAPAGGDTAVAPSGSGAASRP